MDDEIRDSFFASRRLRGATTCTGRKSCYSARAAASLERALRIEPRNPRLWHELAVIRLRQADYGQAESLAARSNTYAGADAELRAANQKVISDARAAKR